MERGRIQGLPKFSEYRLSYRHGKRYKLQIWQVRSQGPSEQKPVKNFGEKGVGVSRDCPNFLSTPYYLRNGLSYELQILYAHS